MLSFLMYTSIFISGAMLFASLALAVMCFIRRNDVLPHTPQEDEEQIKYLEEYFSKKK